MFLVIRVEGVDLIEDLRGVENRAPYAASTRDAYREEWPDCQYAIAATEEAALAKLDGTS